MVAFESESHLIPALGKDRGISNLVIHVVKRRQIIFEIQSIKTSLLLTLALTYRINAKHFCVKHSNRAIGNKL
jgi:hypothetical protein